MTPYYQDDLITLYHGDCRHIDAWLDADVLVTDPPYGLAALAESYGRHGDTIANDLTTEVRDAALSLWGDNKPCLVFGTPRLPDPPGEWQHRLVWDKCEPGLNGGPWRYTHECIFVRGEGWTRRSASSFSVIRYPAQNGSADRRSHPHRKPVELLHELIEAAPEGVVADPFVGSGTTLRAAKDLGRRAIGVELEERYCEVAAVRLSQEVLPFGEAS